MKYIQQFRESFDHRERPYDYEPTVNISKAFIDGVSCYWFTPENPESKKIIIYLHGGGFGAGSILSHDKMITHLAAKLKASTLFIEYRLAPENPFPAGLEDVLRVYQEILAQYPEYQVDFIGDSAGGGLIISVVGELILRNIPRPEAAVLISPWYNLHCEYPSFEANAKIDATLNMEMLKIFAQAYAGDLSLDIPSPSSISFTEFPPVLIMVGTNEIVLDDSKYFYNYIKNVQPLSYLSIYKGQPHVWPKKDVHSEAAQRAFEEMKEFLQEAALPQLQVH
jgi:monoterpene epsilon-lactone hydrolase